MRLSLTLQAAGTCDSPDASRLCDLVLRWTDNLTLAEILDQLVVRLGSVILVVVVALLLHFLSGRLVTRFVRHMESEVRQRVKRARRLGVAGGTAQSETRRLQRLHAVSGAMSGAVRLVIWVTTALVVVSRFVDLRPILAGAGIAGLVVGFGAQNLIRDFLAGLSMLVEDQFGVGDWIEVEGSVGEVESVGLRSTRIRDINGVVWHIPNGHMQKVGNLTQHWARATLDVPVALDTPIPHAREVIQEVADDLAEDPEWSHDIIGRPEVWGVQSWDGEGTLVRLVVPTRPLRNWEVTRQLRERLKYAFDAEGIRVPVPQREVGQQRHPDVEDTEAWTYAPSARRSTPPRNARVRELNTTGRIPTTGPPGPGDSSSGNGD